MLNLQDLNFNCFFSHASSEIMKKTALFPDTTQSYHSLFSLWKDGEEQDEHESLCINKGEGWREWLDPIPCLISHS